MQNDKTANENGLGKVTAEVDEYSQMNVYYVVFIY